MAHAWPDRRLRRTGIFNWGVIRPDFEDTGDSSYANVTDSEYEASYDYEDSYSLYEPDDYEDNYSMYGSDNNYENRYSPDEDRHSYDEFRPVFVRDTYDRQWSNNDNRPPHIR